MHDCCISHATVLQLGKSETLLEDQTIHVREGRIQAIVPEAPGATRGRVLDARGRLVTPGWVNAHHHFYSALARGLPGVRPSTNFLEVLQNLWWRVDRALDLEGVYCSALAGCLDAIRAGTTVIVDHHSSPNCIGGSLDAIGQALSDCGLRGCLAYEVTDRNGPEGALAGIEENVRFAQACANQPEGPLRALFGYHASFTLEPETLQRCDQAAAVGFHGHLAEGTYDREASQASFGQSSLERLREAGFLGEGSVVGHGIDLTEDEARTLAECGARLAHNPQSNLNNAVGIADLDTYASLGIPIVLGTDGMTQNLLQEARAGVWAQRQLRGDPGAGFTSVVDALLLENPKLAGALFGDAGPTLQVGAPADLAIYDYRPTTQLTSDNLRGHLIYGLHEAAVSTTMAGGRVLMHEGIIEVLDEAAALERCRAAASKMWIRFAELNA
ncbi:MAG: amidohydrolase family protein [Opitutales bacterium]